MDHGNPIPFALFFPVILVGIWLAATGAAALFGGWRSLAAHHRAPEGFAPSPDRRASFRSIMLRRWLFPARYNGCMTIGATAQGLYLSPLFVFRFLHPALLISWPAITSCEPGKFLWNRWISLETREGTHVRIYGKISETVLAEWRQHRHDVFAIRTA